MLLKITTPRSLSRRALLQCAFVGLVVLIFNFDVSISRQTNLLTHIQWTSSWISKNETYQWETIENQTVTPLENATVPLLENATQCWRPCPHYNNRITYHFSPAGLHDRVSVMFGLANMAAYLCARLDFPSPANSLTSIHNNGQATLRKSEWTTDFINITLTRDGSNMLQKATHKDMQYIESKKPNQVAQDLETLQGSLTNGTSPYLWNVHMSFYRFRPAILDALSSHPNRPALKREWEGCKYISLSPPQGVWQLARDITNALVPEEERDSVRLVSLHIRRGDAIRECDTSLERVESYLACSLAGGDSFLVLFMSDEEDMKYRSAVQEIVERNGRFLDLDKFVMDYLIRHNETRRENNYFVFNVAELVQEALNIRYRLELRRKLNCRDCDPLFSKNDTSTLSTR